MAGRVERNAIDGVLEEAVSKAKQGSRFQATLKGALAHVVHLLRPNSSPPRGGSSIVQWRIRLFIRFWCDKITTEAGATDLAQPERDEGRAFAATRNRALLTIPA